MVKNNTLKGLFAVFVLISLVFSISAQTVSTITTIGEIDSENNDYVSSSDNIKPSEPEEMVVIKVPAIPAPVWIIEKADEYIISLFGERYFERNFIYDSSSSYTPSPKDPSSYNVVYTYSLKSYVFNTNVRLDDEGNMVDYKGPDKPYKLKIGEQKAIKIAKKAGLKEIITTQTKGNTTWTTSSINSKLVYGGIGYNTDDGTIYESYMWNIWSDKGEEGDIEVVFINLETGEILGIKTFGNMDLVGSHISNEIKIMEEDENKEKVFKSRILSFVKFWDNLFIKR